MIMTLIVQNIKRERQQISVPILQELSKKGKSLGMNRVIVQVRPFGDAIYKSKYFPWSKYISGKQGRQAR